jgi:phosphoenolpyruvate carboxykinase (ATP)
MGDHHLDVYLMNTGRVGGADGVEGSEKVRIKHSSAIVKGIAEGTIEWADDPDFGYQVAKSVPGIEESDAAVLRPRELYEKLGRSDEYKSIVNTLKSERADYLKKYPALSEEIVAAVS